MKPTLLILAAGMGSRYGSLKQIDAVGPSGEAIIDYSIYDAIRAGFEKVTFIIRRSIEKDFREVFDEKLKGKIETGAVRGVVGGVQQEAVEALTSLGFTALQAREAVANLPKNIKTVEDAVRHILQRQKV